MNTKYQLNYTTPLVTARVYGGGLLSVGFSVFSKCIRGMEFLPVLGKDYIVASNRSSVSTFGDLVILSLVLFELS